MSQQPNNQTAGWIPSLTGLGLPQQLTDSMTQSFTLLYSLRDSVTSNQTSLGRMNQYGAHSKRVQQTAAASVPDGGLYFESDRRTVFYQARIAQVGSSPRWFYAGGLMFDTVTAPNDHRPGDLGTEDTGFLFLASDTLQLYRWDGAHWVAV